MNIALTPELEKLVNEKVKNGQYSSANEVIGAGLRLLEERDSPQPSPSGRVEGENSLWHRG